MLDERRTREVLGPADPARDITVPPPRTTPSGLIAIAETTAPRPGARRPSRARLRLASAGMALAVAAVAAVAAHSLAARDRSPSGTAPPDATLAATEPRLGPVIRVAAVQYPRHPPAAGDRLRALAERIGPARHDAAIGRFAYIRTVGWNAVTDDVPGGGAQIIHPRDTRVWYAADGSGRIAVTALPPVYPNEQSRRYWQRQGTATAPARSTHPPAGDLPAGMAGPADQLPSDPAALAARLGVPSVAPHGVSDVLLAVRDVYASYLVPRQVRAEILRILADLPGISWRGAVTDRAGRAGVAVSADTATSQELLIFDPTTGTLLAWDEMTRPTDTVAGATLILAHDRTDRRG